MSNSTRDMLHETLRDTRAHLLDLMERIENGDDSAHDELAEMPLEVVCRVGKPLAVVLGVGGPHVEIVEDIGNGSPRIVGHWAGETVEFFDSELCEFVLRFFIPEYDDLF